MMALVRQRKSRTNFTSEQKSALVEAYGGGVNSVLKENESRIGELASKTGCEKVP